MKMARRKKILNQAMPFEKHSSQPICGSHLHARIRALIWHKKTHLKERRAWIWRPQQESNLHLALRRRSFYPLNYGGGISGFYLPFLFG